MGMDLRLKELYLHMCYRAARKVDQTRCEHDASDMEYRAEIVLAGMELNFIAACIVLYFSFLARTVSTIHQCFLVTAEQYIKVLLLSHCAPTASRLGVSKKLGGDAFRTADL